MAAPTIENLQRLAQLLDAGNLQVPIQDTYPFEAAAAAMNALATTHTQGKIALQIA
jgi:NADPH:quinone reductase-like Zn-dependent oxidoreductase